MGEIALLKIAVTGGIGSGKTAVTDYLSSKGYTVIDADQIAHQITAPGGKAIPYIRNHFGDDFIREDGSMDRDKMRERVYGNPDQLRLLEEGTTKAVIRVVEDRVRECRDRGDKVVFLAIPLLFETGSAGVYAAVWSVVADNNVRIRRVMERDRLTEEMVRKIMSRQVSDDVRRAGSSDIIDNSGTLAELHSQVDHLLQKYIF